MGVDGDAGPLNLVKIYKKECAPKFLEKFLGGSSGAENHFDENKIVGPIEFVNYNSQWPHTVLYHNKRTTWGGLPKGGFWSVAQTAPNRT